MSDRNPFGPDRRRAKPAPQPVEIQGERDADGVLIPENYPRRNWDRRSLPTRQKLSQVYEERVARDAARDAAKAARPTREPSTHFTTDYAIAWGKAQGWRLVERERVKWFRDKNGEWKMRHEDLAGASDAMFRAPEGMVFVQGAGVGERASHRRTFEERRHQLEDYRNPKFIYLEFARGSKAPVKEEWWV